MIDQINEHLNKFDYDIRKTRNARFMDQKITPDVLCIIADCVINHVDNSKNENLEFTTKDIWNYKYSNDNVKVIFNKPDVLDKSAKSEYDKFFQQPLKTLAYSKVLSCRKKGGQNYFKIANKDILKYISIKERNSLNFLLLYLEKVLKDSCVWKYFEDFFNNNDKEHFNRLKTRYENFILNNTLINGRVEIRRIFTKIINPLSYSRRLHGTKNGFYSKFVIDYEELMYNRRNWRDIAKLKNETRKQYETRAKAEIETSRNAYIKYSIQKAKSIIKKYHYPKSEVNDKFANDIANHIHHIFLSSDYPQIASYLENLILLTANQHLTHAHPNNNTRLINRDYQLVCLLSKSETIEKSLSQNNFIYVKEDFLFVLETGLQVKFNDSVSFREIRDKLVTLYNQN